MISQSDLFCGTHRAMLPDDVRRALERHHKPGKPPSKVLYAALAGAVRELVFYEAEGHRMPRDRSLPFDEAPEVLSAAR